MTLLSSALELWRPPPRLRLSEWSEVRVRILMDDVVQAVDFVNIIYISFLAILQKHQEY